MQRKEYFKGNLFWAILGRADQLDTQDWTENISYFCRVLSVTPKKLSRETADFQKFFSHISIEIQKENIRICISNLAIYQGTESKNVQESVPDNSENRDTPKTRDLITKTKTTNSNKFSSNSLKKVGPSDSEKFENKFKFNYDDLFSIYPRFQAKFAALKIMAEEVTDQGTYDQVKIAITRYREMCEREKTEFSKIKLFENWWPNWQEWLDPRAGQSQFKESDPTDEFLKGEIQP